MHRLKQRLKAGAGASSAAATPFQAIAGLSPTTSVDTILAQLNQQQRGGFDGLARLLAANDSGCQRIAENIAWDDEKTLLFLIEHTTEPQCIPFIVTHLIERTECVALYKAIRKRQAVKPGFYLSCPAEIQYMIIPFIVFEYVIQNLKTTKKKTSKKIKLSDITPHDFFEDASVYLINDINTLMRPFTHQRIQKPCVFETTTVASTLVALLQKLGVTGDAVDEDTVLAHVCGLSVNIQLLLSPFDRFLEHLKISANVIQKAYLHHVLSFFQRPAIMHSADTTLSEQEINKMVGYFREQREGKAKWSHQRGAADTSLYQQLYFCSFLIMSTHFSQNRLMSKNCRPHVNRILYCQEQSPFYSPQTTTAQRQAYNVRFKAFGEHIHFHYSVFSAMAMLYQGNQVQCANLGSASLTAITPSGAPLVLKADEKTIPNYLRFYNDLMAYLSPQEIDVLCYNPDFCIEIYCVYLLKATNVPYLKPITIVYPACIEISQPAPTEGGASASGQAIDRLSDIVDFKRLIAKCWYYAISVEALQISGKAFEEVITDNKIESLLDEIPDAMVYLGPCDDYRNGATRTDEAATTAATAAAFATTTTTTTMATTPTTP